MRVIIDDIDDGAQTMSDRIVRENQGAVGNVTTATRVPLLTLMRQLIYLHVLTSMDAGDPRIRSRISWRAFCRACSDSRLFSHSIISFLFSISWALCHSCF
jgi:hypothetical protein